VERTSLDPSEVGDIVVGTVIAPGSQRAMECRVAAYFAGFPGTKSHSRIKINLISHKLLICFFILLFYELDSVPVRTVNRQCSSGLQAVADVAASIRAGYYDIGKMLLHQFFVVSSCLYRPWD